MIPMPPWRDTQQSFYFFFKLLLCRIAILNYYYHLSSDGTTLQCHSVFEVGQINTAHLPSFFKEA